MSAEVARLVLFELMNAAQQAPKPFRQVFVITDEFQRAVSGNIEALLPMARRHDISLILAITNELRQLGSLQRSRMSNAAKGEVASGRSSSILWNPGVPVRIPFWAKICSSESRI